MSFTRAQWSIDFLKAIGNAAPAQDTVNFVVGWTCFETNTNSGAKFNLLNTTQPMNVAGVSDFNSVGVKSYPDYGTGIKANAFTVLNGRYPYLASALLNNDTAKLKNPTSGIIANINTWGTGGSKAVQFISTGANRGGDTFNYGSATGVGSLPPPITTQSTGPENPQVGVGGQFDWLTPQFIGKMSVGIGLVVASAILLVRSIK